ncbi:NAD(P)-dependent alcohol dehydrogenase [Protofrankia symbiont of Coriaria ruscifolia]|uniref:NAD(P)-dependent alcohol dehydrogenase n=1 Tax=Protofrankia symbiont of Coriaria ruscifolia TaxID=1306542 RepID=UPI0010419CEB|nr:NAD(P)-dependent alcohol dehydrogenase [Protofrankia symbiont of Coriaria ruscifolia]
MDITAAVVAEIGGEFSLDKVSLDAPAADEVLVEIAGVGLCHTDLAVKEGHLPFPLPGVFGHEGSGVVVEAGSAVTKIRKGDRVALSFNSCGRCTQCKKGAPAYCHEFMAFNFSGARPDGTSALSLAGTTVGSNFFGQSSFGTHAIAHERNVVKVSDLAPLSLVGPLGCGIQTGAGAVLNSLDCEAGASLVVLGGGSVGLSAVLAAVVRELTTIIVVEPLQARRDLALSLGAIHAIDPADGPLSEQIRSIVPDGVDYAVDTTAIVPVLEQTLLSLAHRGTLGILGVPADPTSALSVNLIQAQVLGVTITGIVEGDSDPDRFIPELLELHQAGRFPFEKMITTMPFTQINEAVAAQHRGEAVKIVLVHE